MLYLVCHFEQEKKPLYIGKCQQRKLILHYTITTLVNGFPFTTDPCRVGDHILKGRINGYCFVKYNCLLYIIDEKGGFVASFLVENTLKVKGLSVASFGFC